MADLNNVTISDDSEVVELFFSCRSLADKDFMSKSDPVLYLKKCVSGNQYAEVGRTEVVKNDLNPDFATSFRVEFVFETRQKFRVEVVDVDNFKDLSGDYIGGAEFELADVVGSMHNMKILRLTNDKEKETGKCIVRLDKVGDEIQKKIQMKLSVLDVPKTSFFSGHNSFIRVYKMRLSDELMNKVKEGDVKYESLPVNEWLLVYKSQPVKGKDISLPPICMKGSKLCNNNFDVPLKIELWKYKSSGSHRFLGQLFLTVNDLIARLYEHRFQPNKGLTVATLMVDDFKLEDVYEFVDYLRGGLNMTLVVGIDFTASNRDPTDPQSLHYINPPHLNLYQQSILSVGEILQKYNHAQQIPAYGFGAKVGQPPTISHFFPLNFNPNDPCVSNFGDLFKLYHSACQDIIFSGPTYFAPIFQQVLDFTNRRFEMDPNNYTVFLLLTDGIVNDMQMTIDQIVKGCHLPLSIIIIGIGNEDFTKMEVLDADDVPLVSSWGEQMRRDIVQFVPFNKFKNNPLVLREEVLDELPRQVTSFYNMKGIRPKEFKPIDPAQFNLARGNTQVDTQQYQGLFIDTTPANYPTLE